MKGLENLPQPVTEKDVTFMEYLLRGVRDKRLQATAGPEILVVKKTKTNEKEKL